MNPARAELGPALTPARIAEAAHAQLPYMTDTLSTFVAAASPSGAEQPAAAFMEGALLALGLESERIHMNSDALKGLPLYSPPCCGDGGRYNLLAVHEPRAEGGRSVLFNGHLDVVPTGPENLWREPPFSPHVEDGWLFGRGAGDMKAGIVCTLAAFKALRALGVQPAGRVGFNAVLEEESTGNGALASVSALRNAVNAGKLIAFDVVVIPEPLGERMISAQVGVLWLFIELTGRPAHAAYMGTGASAIEAGIAVIADLKRLEAEWNAPQNRHPAYREHAHPINFNIGQISGGEWNSSVPCTCTLGVRIGFYPDMPVDVAKARVASCVQATVARLGSGLSLNISYEGFHAPGCEFDLDGPGLQCLAAAHRTVHDVEVSREATTATTDARHFKLMLDAAVTCYGPEARNIHGIDESVSLASMLRVTTTLTQFLHDWCGIEPAGPLRNPK
jgi:acetylornithine deacetylase